MSVEEGVLGVGMLSRQCRGGGLLVLLVLIATSAPACSDVDSASDTDAVSRPGAGSPSPTDATASSTPSPEANDPAQAGHVKQPPCGRSEVSDGQPTVSSKYRCYVVSGDTAAALVSEMDRLGPGPDHAYTRWYVEYGFRFSASGATCRIETLDVSVRTVFTLPRWADPRRASQDLRTEWNRYLKAVLVHENGHRRLGEEAGARVFRRLDGFEAACSEIERRVNELANSTIAEQRRREDRYDARTDHGRTQGARLAV